MSDSATRQGTPQPTGSRPGAPTLLVGYDGSASACRALDYAVRLVADRAGRLVIVYVHNTLLLAIAPELMPDITTASAETEAAIRQELADRLGAEQVPWELVCLEGNPFLLLMDQAANVGAEAIVLGGSRRTGLRLSGSLAVNLVKKARWPVVVVP